MTDKIELERELTARLCKKSFYHFVKTFWHVIEPLTPFKDGWHIRVICEHLEAVAEFKIQKLIINMPPRHMKSILCSVMFPAWVWLKYPERRFIYGSYAESLSMRDSIKCRTIIESDLYIELFKPDWHLSDDENRIKLFTNTKTGQRLSVGVGGALTGQGGDYLFIDDPVNAIDGHSDAIREEANRWHDVAFSTRFNDAKNHAKVIIMQRLHEDDLCGHVLTKDKYEKLILPARFEFDHELPSKTSLNFKDPRTKEGELLWPDKFDDKTIKDLEEDLGIDAEAQLQQVPKPISGHLFDPEDWVDYEIYPSPILEIVQFWDCAQKPGISNDWSVCATWARTQNAYYVLDVWREKTTAPLLEEMAVRLFHQHRPNAVVIEDKSAGSSLIQYLTLSTTLPIFPVSPTKDKLTRAIAATPTVKAKKCYLKKNAPWAKNFIDEHKKFGVNAKHDDQVDTTSMAIDYFKTKNLNGPRIRSL